MTGDIIPQPGYQMDFLTSPADIVIGGGAAGAGKTVGLLIDSVRHVDVQGYGAVIFRVSYPQIMMPGGLWDESMNMFPALGGQPKEMEWRFVDDKNQLVSNIMFRHLGHENELLSYQGAQIAFIGFDELTHFTLKMFLYIMTRNRSTCGIRPVIRATCNPDPESWLADFLSWWIDPETGYPIPERAGVLRYFVVQDGNFIWGSSVDEVLALVPSILEDPLFKDIPREDLVKSATFIPGTISDNPALMRANPQYLANLLAQDEETQARLLRGNWRIRADKLSLFDYVRIGDLFTNLIPPNPTDLYYLTCDHARFGRDLCVIGTWKGWRLVRIDILPKSDTNDVLRVIKYLRTHFRGIPSSQIMIDQDGIGVHDAIQCKVFHGGGPAVKVTMKTDQSREPGTQKKLPADYKNFRTQCYYYMAEEKANKALMSVDLNNVWLHNSDIDIKQVTRIKLKGKEVLIRDLIRDDIRVLRREDPDHEGKKQMTSKELQKAAIGNRSPDFGDMMAMRSAFDFIRQPRYLS